MPNACTLFLFYSRGSVACTKGFAHYTRIPLSTLDMPSSVPCGVRYVLVEQHQILLLHFIAVPLAAQGFIDSGRGGVLQSSSGSLMGKWLLGSLVNPSGRPLVYATVASGRFMLLLAMRLNFISVVAHVFFAGSSVQSVEVDNQQCMLEILDTAGTVSP